MAYFDGNDKAPGLYYSRMDGVAWVTSPAKKFGDNTKQAGHPSIVSVGKQVWLVWREMKEGHYAIWAMHSDDEGKSWQAPKALLTSTQKLDYPVLLLHQQQPYLICNGQQLGLSVISLIPSY
jgi:Neuraminidase (sialidase)